MAETNTRGKKQKKSLQLEIPSVLVTHVNVTAVAQEGGTAAFHDTVKMSTTLSDDKLTEVFKSMGITRSAFAKSLPGEIPKFNLNCKYENHEFTLKSVPDEGGNMFAYMADVVIYDFNVDRVGVGSYQLEFKAKGIPDQDNHESFEASWLSGMEGVFFDLFVKGPAKATADMNLGDEKEEEQEPATA